MARIKKHQGLPGNTLPMATKASYMSAPPRGGSSIADQLNASRQHTAYLHGLLAAVRAELAVSYLDKDATARKNTLSKVKTAKLMEDLMQRNANLANVILTHNNALGGACFGAKWHPYMTLDSVRAQKERLMAVAA